MESHLRTKRGRIITGLLSAQLISLQGNDYIISEIRDITHLKKAEEALKESRQLLRHWPVTRLRVFSEQTIKAKLLM